jgi:hypothetical protein
MRRLPALLLIVLSACTGNPAQPIKDGASDGTLPNDPCALVTVKEVEGVTGSPVVRSSLVPDERQHRPEDPNPCEYVTDGKHASITVYVDPHGAADFARDRDRDPRNTVTIAGLGDEAFSLGLSALYVRVGDGYFWLASQHGAGWPGLRDLKELARTAIE